MQFERYRFAECDVHFAALDSLAEWPADDLACPGTSSLLVVADGKAVPDDVMQGFARKIARQGIGWVAFWGPDSERAHDAFDRALLATASGDAAAYEQLLEVMTAWHTEDAPDEAIWSLLWCSPHGEAHVYFVVVAGLPGWVDHVRSRLADPYGPWLDDLDY